MQKEIQPLLLKVAGPCLTFIAMVCLLIGNPQGLATGNPISYIAVGLMVIIVIFIAIVTRLHLKEIKNRQIDASKD